MNILSPQLNSINKKKILMLGCGSMGQKIRSILLKDFDVITITKTAKYGYCDINQLESDYYPDVLLIAIKPQTIHEVLSLYKRFNNSLVISIAAGIVFDKYCDLLNNNGLNILRLMPNIAINQNEGVIGFIKNNSLINDQSNSYLADVILKQLSDIAKIIEIKNESDFDIFTVITSCSPAFFLKILDIFIDVVVSNFNSSSINADIIKYVFSSCSKILNNNNNLKSIIASIASKGGVTQEGLNVLDKSNIADILLNTISKSLEKSKNM